VEFSYRSSIFKTKALNEIVFCRIYLVKKGERNEIERKSQGKNRSLETSTRWKIPNAGSVFKNVPVKISLAHKDELSGYIKKTIRFRLSGCKNNF